MTALRLKLDENLPRRVEPALRALGHDVETVVAERLAGSSDPAVPTACDRIHACKRSGSPDQRKIN